MLFCHQSNNTTNILIRTLTYPGEGAVHFERISYRDCSFIVNIIALEGHVGEAEVPFKRIGYRDCSFIANLVVTSSWSIEK